MEMKGEARLEASRQFVWDALNNPKILQASIPGCESLEVTAENEFTAVVVSKVGPIKARFQGKVTLSDIVAPKSYKLTGEGSGGAAGFAKADIEVALDAIEPEVTLLRYTVNANVGGKLAQLGSRMIDAAASKSADEFFEGFGKQVQSSKKDAPVETVSSANIDILNVASLSSEPGPEIAPIQSAPVQVQVGVASAIQAMRLDAAVASQAALEVMTANHVKVWVSDQIATVTINRATSRNAMTYAMWRAFPGILAALERNPDVRAVILTGAGEDFSAGADIPEFQTVRNDAEQATAYEVAVDACCDAIYNFKKPTIAVLRGYCLGGGAHLAMSCDFRYATETAIFGIPAARLSIIYGVRGTRKLLSLVGLTQAKKILLGAQRFDATEALKIGFIDHIAKQKSQGTPAWWERLMGIKSKKGTSDPMVDARAFAELMAKNAPLSMAGAKHQLNAMARGSGGLDLQHAEVLIAQAASSADYREGRDAFAAKRQPDFQGQ